MKEHTVMMSFQQPKFDEKHEVLSKPGWSLHLLLRPPLTSMVVRRCCVRTSAIMLYSHAAEVPPISTSSLPTWMQGLA